MFAGAAFAGGDLRGEYVEGEALVVLEGPTEVAAGNSAAFEASISASAKRVAASVGAQPVGTFSAISAGVEKNIFHIKSSSKSTEQLLAELERVHGVLGASPNYIRSISRTPNDPRYGDLWGMPYIRAPRAWDETIGSREIYVAVIDTGIDYNHNDLSANMGRDLDGNFGRDTVNGDNNPMDDHSHGTHVAGTIGAVGNNAVGVAGVNWQVSLLGVKVLDARGFGNDAQIIAGLDYVVAQKRRGLNIRVANMSLGGWSTPITNPNTNPYALAHKAVSDAGILLVVAAGNEFQNIDRPGGPGSDPYHPFRDYRGMLPYPASFRFENMITVASITSAGRRSDFSNYSPNYVQLAAPGSGVLSTTPGNSYATMNGTSMATPHVAGAAALLAAKRPEETASQIKSRILNYVAPNANLDGLVTTNGHLDLGASITAVNPVPVRGVSLEPASLNLRVGQRANLTATIEPDDADDTTVAWFSSNSSIARVSPVTAAQGSVSATSSATVEGIAAGTVTITVMTNDGQYTATSEVTVSAGGGGGGGCSVGPGAAIPAILLLLIPLAMLTKRSAK